MSVQEMAKKIKLKTVRYYSREELDRLFLDLIAESKRPNAQPGELRPIDPAGYDFR